MMAIDLGVWHQNTNPPPAEITIGRLVTYFKQLKAPISETANVVRDRGRQQPKSG